MRNQRKEFVMSNVFASKDLTIGQINALVKILGGHEAVLRILRRETADVEAWPDDKLFQTEDQRNGKVVTLEEMCKAAPQRQPGTNRLDWYFAHPEAIPASWNGKNIYFPETECCIGGGRCRSIRYLFSNGGRWCQSYVSVSLGVGRHDFVAVPSETK